jgi:HSP20 family protein
MSMLTPNDDRALVPQSSQHIAPVSGPFMPAIDMYEDPATGNLVIMTPVAGVDPSRLHAEISDGVLTIEGSAEHTHELEETHYYHKEIRTGSFVRKVALPSSIDESQINASLKDGLLTITCKRTEEQHPQEPIAIAIQTQ